jgi:isoleucyl-tRNA synthetase
MSKRLNNYTSPDELINIYGADVLRLYLIGSPASKAESLCFKNSELFEITKKLIPYYNAHLFLKECIIYLDSNYEIVHSSNKLDNWIINVYYKYSNMIYEHIEKLELNVIPNLIFKFIDILSNYYIKLSRDRLKYQLTTLDCNESVNTLLYILNKFNKLLVPFTPYLSEYLNLLLNKNTNNFESINLSLIDIQKFEIDKNLLNGFYSVGELLECVRNLRHKINKSLIYPLNNMVLYTDNIYVIEFLNVICKELNIKKLILKPTDSLSKVYKPNKNMLGKHYKKNAHIYIKMIEDNNINFDECLLDFYNMEYILEEKENMIGDKFTYFDHNNKICESIVYIDTITDKNNDFEADINTIRRQINNLRKDMNLKIYNKVNIIFENHKFWNDVNNVNNELINNLNHKLATNILFEEKLENYNIIKTYTDIELKVYIKI